MAGNSNSGRSALPASVHVLRGNPSKRPLAELQRELREPSVPVEAPPKPAFLQGEAADEWDRVVAALLELGWITTLDQAALATYCEAYGRWLKLEREVARLNAASADGLGGELQTFPNGTRQEHPVRSAAKSAAKAVNQAGALFGFSPVARRAMKAMAAHPQGELIPNGPRDAADAYFS
ncbi:phage terminase small subunit P27 family [Pseudomonas oryzihabitans]|uniref:phage terminase small subunit P27 family n=1 Tax=Pseudomonas oryzihabitans TaxID=47885 RepID=UPI002895C3AC|nr:phage terminase small subunit P27 family [Pseudomonas oryzihabitans]MDT3720338.1 phage terminase small subunit P27 family [Pseudomonas oryzihabitans]